MVRAPLAAALVVPVPDKALDRRLEAALDDDGQLLDGASPALAAARREVQSARARLIKKLETILRAAEGAGDAGVTVRGAVAADSRARSAVVPSVTTGRPEATSAVVASGIANMGLTEVTKACAPWILVMLLFLLLITYVPAITLWLPNLLMG